MQQLLNQVLETTINSFDLSFCISVNILTYLIVKAIDELNGDKPVTTLQKRLVLLLSIIILSSSFYLTGNDIKLIVNSAILAPVSWSWILRPICDKLNINYKKNDYRT